MKLNMWTSRAAVLALVFWPVAGAAESAPDSLVNDLRRLESVREVKSLQRTYAQLGGHGLWRDMAALFADDGKLVWGQGKPGADILSTDDAISLTGPPAIELWLRVDAGNMDGIWPGSLHALINEVPVISLSEDGNTAKGRWHLLRFLGDGQGKTRIQGGLMENDYVLSSTAKGDRWQIQRLRYYPMFEGNYKNGWANVGGNNLPVIPYHYTPDSAGMPILSESTSPAKNSSGLSLDELQYRISQLNDEDEVRNLHHTYGHYLDRRMWPDVVDLFTPDGVITVDGNSSAPGPAGIERALEQMGPAGLARGVLNEHAIFQTIVEVGPDGREATSRGLEIGMIGDETAKTASWQFSEFRHRYTKDPATALWKIKELSYTRLMLANYSAGWATGGLLPPRSPATPPPAFLDVLGHLSDTARKPAGWTPLSSHGPANATSASDLRRRLSRSAAWDEAENISGAYSFYADDIRCADFANLHAAKGFKESPGIGFYLSPARIRDACAARYGNGTLSATPRPRTSVPFHWRTQPVVLVSEDARSATVRAKNLQTGTDKTSPGGSYMGGMYHDQMVRAPPTTAQNGTTTNAGTRMKLWCLTIDEFYWSSASWQGGWANVTSTAVGRRGSVARPPYLLPFRHKREGINGYDADVALTDPKFGPREVGFNGGPTRAVSWPNIQKMWFAYRNPVSGRVPDTDQAGYWPGCVPCKVRPDWSLMANGYQEPATGPTRVAAAVAATASGVNVTVTVQGGPDEPVSGVVQLRKGDQSEELIAEALLGGDGDAAAAATTTFAVPAAVGGSQAGKNQLVVYYLGSARLQPGRATVVW